MDDQITARLDRIDAENAALRAELDALRSTIDAAPVTPTGDPRPDDPTTAGATAGPTNPTTPATPTPTTLTPKAPTKPGGTGAGALGRRRALKAGLGLAGAAAAGAVVTQATPAAAGAGQPIIQGVDNDGGPYTTAITGAGSRVLRVSGTTPNDVLRIENANTAGTAAIVASNGTGLAVDGNQAHIRFVRAPARQAPYLDTRAHVRGETLLDAFSTLWFCSADGTPGTWRTLSGPGHAGAFYPWPTPRRAYDSRPGSTPNVGPKTKLAPGEDRTIDLRPTFATNAATQGVLVQVLLVNATAGAGNFTIWSGGVARPLANTMVWGGTAGRFSSLTYTNVSDARYVQVNASLATHLVLDVIGTYG